MPEEKAISLQLRTIKIIKGVWQIQDFRKTVNRRRFLAYENWNIRVAEVGKSRPFIWGSSQVRSSMKAYTAAARLRIHIAIASASAWPLSGK